MLNNLGSLDRDQGRTEEARKEFAEALQTRRELARENPETYRPYVATTLNAPGGLWIATRAVWRKPRRNLSEALQIRRELAHKNPETYRPDVAEDALTTWGFSDLRPEAGRRRHAKN